MVMLRLFIIGFSILLHSTTYGAGVDEIFEKQFSDKTWGQVATDFLPFKLRQKSYALVIGISNYDDNSLPTLPTSDDAVKVKNYLLHEAGYDYVHLVTEEKATLSRVKELIIDVFPDLISEGDRFVFYWSGHGITRPTANGPEGYLPLQRSNAESYSSMLSMDDLKKLDALTNARQSLYLLDSCFSGLAGSAIKSSEAGKEKISIIEGKSSHLMTAGTSEQQTIATDQYGSLFTHAILEGLRGEADSSNIYPADGIVTLHELKGYVETRMERERINVGWHLPITPQIRDLSSGNGEYYFVTSDIKKKIYEELGHVLTGEFSEGYPKTKSNSQSTTLQDGNLTHIATVIEDTLNIELTSRINTNHFEHAHVYLNIDSDKATGYIDRNGGDLMLQGGFLYKHDPNRCHPVYKNWCWDYENPIDVNRNSNSQTEFSYMETWSIPLSLLGRCPPTIELVSEITFSEDSHYEYNRIKNPEPITISTCKPAIGDCGVSLYSSTDKVQSDAYCRRIIPNISRILPQGFSTWSRRFDSDSNRCIFRFSKYARKESDCEELASNILNSLPNDTFDSVASGFLFNP